jgi:hypothetical protein
LRLLDIGLLKVADAPLLLRYPGRP